MQRDDRVLIDYRTSDDAGVYRLDDGRALVQTVDFFTPIVDDPFVYGQIAAANALSDIYAMGGRALTALAIACFPKDADEEVLGRIFAGGLDKLGEARVALLGGHTVQDQEIKFGYAVTGEADPDRIWANAGARPGDVLLLTKALGTGAIATALKFDRLPPDRAGAAIRSMLTLNRHACDVLRQLPDGVVHACTDITGFGLVGHATEMALASRCTIEIDAARVPILPEALDLAAGNVPAGGRTNAEHFADTLSVAAGVDPRLTVLFHDPQTSGGLFVAVDPADADRAEAALGGAGVSVWRVGQAVERRAAAVAIA